jgi:hypothetical protein
MGEIIQSLWVGPRLSAMERTCIASFLRHGHSFHLYVYERPDDIPPGTVVLDASEIIPASRIFTYKEHNTYAGFANFFRYKLLLEKGGWFVDADTICLRPFDFDSVYVFSSEGLNGRQTVNLGALKVPRASPVVEHCWAECEKLDTAELKWSQCGPQLMARAVESCGLQRYVKPPEVFCPIHFSEWKRLLDPKEDCEFGDATYAVHLWNELWRREGLNKDGPYPAGSVYEELRQRYLEE